MRESLHLPEINRARAEAYAAEAVSQAARLLSLLDREAHSPSYGSFDREHWGWKFRDFPVTMQQTGIYPLALLWRFRFPKDPYYHNPNLLKWIEAGIDSTCRRQHKNGAFDSAGPFTQDHGVTLAMVFTLAEVWRLLSEEFSAALCDRIRETVKRACQFALRSSEDYAFISNHQALFAVALLDAAELLGEERYRDCAEQIIEEIIRRQSPDGWYREYDGPDPGYESLGIFYLATYWKRTGSPVVLASLRRSIEFYAYCVHPDGSTGGVYGSRHTSLYYPGGFEILAGEIPMAATVAWFMRERLPFRNVVTPAISDAENLPSLMYSYLEAYLSSDDRRGAEMPPLPCQALTGRQHFPDSGIVTAGNLRYYAVANLSRGGVCRVFNKRTSRIAYEDAGYLVRAGGRRWTSQLIGLGRPVGASGAEEVACTTSLAEVSQEMLTPAKFILLRALNLTLFRSLRLGSWFRRRVIARLITAKRPGPFRLTRSITFGLYEILFRDRLEMDGTAEVEEVALPRSLTAVDMGSAKYFHSSELDDTLPVAVGGMTSDLNQSRASQCEFAVQFYAIAQPEFSADHLRAVEERLRKEALA